MSPSNIDIVVAVERATLKSKVFLISPPNYLRNELPELFGLLGVHLTYRLPDEFNLDTRF